MELAHERFEDWVGKKEPSKLFVPTSQGKVRQSTLLRNMFLELASLVDILIKEGYCPTRLDIADLYIKNKVEGGGPTLKVLLVYKVVPIGSCTTLVQSAWKAVQDIMDKCCQRHNVTLDDTALGFRNYFGKHTSPKHLELYPDSWTDEEKKNYIFMIIHGEKLTMENAIVSAKVQWPMDPTDPKKAVPIVEAIFLQNNKNKKAKPYEKGIPWSYVRLCRNSLKSFDQIPSGLVKDRAEFLRKMEEWESAIWTKLYEEIGPLEGGELDC